MIFRFPFIIGLQSDKLMGHSEEEVVGALVEEKQEVDTNQNLPLNCKEEGGKGMKVEKVDTIEKSSNDRPAKSNLKRKLSFKLSCKSEEEMKHAIRTLKSNDGGLDLDVSALVSEN